MTPLLYIWMCLIFYFNLARHLMTILFTIPYLCIILPCYKITLCYSHPACLFTRNGFC